MEYILKHNQEAEQGKHTFRLGINQFADVTNEEWKNKFIPRELRNNLKGPNTTLSKPASGRPEFVDWRDEVRYIKIT